MALKIKQNGEVKDLIIPACGVEVLDMEDNFGSSNLEEVLQELGEGDRVYISDENPDKDGIWVSSDNTTIAGENPTLTEVKEYVNENLNKMDEKVEIVSSQLNDIENSLTLNKNNFYSNVHLYQEVNIEKTIKNLKKAGIQGIYITLHIDGDNNCSLKDDLNRLKELQSCAIQNGLKADVLKFHNTIEELCTNGTIQNNYLQKIQSLIPQFTGINRIILLNEREDIIQNNLTFALNCVNTIKGLGYKVGVTITNPYQIQLCLEKSPSFFNAIDFLGSNNYPIITAIPEKVEFNDSLYAWESVEKHLLNIKSKIKCPILLTEVGIIPHEEFLSAPWAWDSSKVSSQKNEKIFQYLTYGLFENENLMTKVFDEISFWYLENSWYTDDKTFEYINKYVKRGEN